nr:putative RNA-directed DNA polymerase, eukaryota, reverse transcriptase zinc-binding domain protein [Tanacetum cinerariifolium]
MHPPGAVTETTRTHGCRKPNTPAWGFINSNATLKEIVVVRLEMEGVVVAAVVVLLEAEAARGGEWGGGSYRSGEMLESNTTRFDHLYEIVVVRLEMEGVATAAVVVLLESGAARCGEWGGGSYRSGWEERFWGSPEKFSGGDGGVDWGFLKQTLMGFGFHDRMIHWIMKCVTSTSFSLSINVVLHGYFKGQRWLCQGDPMSPFLFILIMEIRTLTL